MIYKLITGITAWIRTIVALFAGLGVFFGMLIITGGLLSILLTDGVVEYLIIMVIMCLEIPTAIYASLRLGAIIYPDGVDVTDIDDLFGVQ